jgi:ABC-type bacteriocin/lantibiotic exporter with double-glycine peptidase domain
VVLFNGTNSGIYGAPINDNVLVSESATTVPDNLQFEPPWRKSGDCGPLALYVLMRLRDREVSVAEVEEVLPFDARTGCSFADITRAAEALDFATEVRFVNPRQLRQVPYPYILHGAGSLERGVGHFLVVVGFSPEKSEYYVIDTDYETLRSQTEESILMDFTGYVMRPKEGFMSMMEAPMTDWTMLILLALLCVAAFFLNHVRTAPNGGHSK